MANLHGKAVERINVERDVDGDITAVDEYAATLVMPRVSTSKVDAREDDARTTRDLSRGFARQSASRGETGLVI